MAALRVDQAVGDGVRQRQQLLGAEQLEQLAAPGLLPLAQPRRGHGPARPTPGPAAAARLGPLATAGPSDGRFRYGATRRPPAPPRPPAARRRGKRRLALEFRPAVSVNSFLPE